MSATVSVSPAVLVIALASLVFAIVTVVDMARRPGWLWRQAGSNKGLWLTLEIICFVLLGFLSIIVGVLYFALVRPRLQAVEARGGPGGPGLSSGGPGWQQGGSWPPQGGPWPGQMQAPQSGPWPTASYPPPAHPEGTAEAPPPAPPAPETGPPAYPSTPGPPGTMPPAFPPQPAQRDLPPFGWYPDPSRRHEQRYWDGTRWTEHVRDGGQDSTEALPG